MFFLAWAVVQESAALSPEIKQWTSAVEQLKQGNVSTTIPLVGSVRTFSTSAFGMKQAQFKANLAAHVNHFLENISLFGTEAAASTLVFIVDALIMLFSLFFVFRDGLKFLTYVQTLLPMRRDDKEKLANTIQDTIIGVARGLFFTSIAQGVLATVAYFIVGVHGAILLGSLTAIIGLVPVVGTFAVWIPIGIYYLAHGIIWKGAFVLLWGTLVVVAFCDTVLRPYLVGKKGELHFFALFVALLGGVEVWGAKGMILGPLVVAIVPIMLDIYQSRYLRQFGAEEELDEARHEQIVETAKVELTASAVNTD